MYTDTGSTIPNDSNSAKTTATGPTATTNTNGINYDPSAIYYCSSRWLLAHHDPTANIKTNSKYMVLADIHQDSDNPLALIDFKKRDGCCDASIPPYDCRLQVYRGQQMVYSHFLSDIPSAMIATCCRSSIGITNSIKHQQESRYKFSELNLAITINDDIYFYKRLKPSQKVSLEDHPKLLDSMQKAEIEAWQMVKENKLLNDGSFSLDTLRELLSNLRDVYGSQQLSSHSINFLSLRTEEERKSYLSTWRHKIPNKSVSHQGDQWQSSLPRIESMDTICCATNQRGFPFNSNWSTNLESSGSKLRPIGFKNSMSSINREISPAQGLIVGTEDRHLLIYDLSFRPAQLRQHFRLPATPDHILWESPSPEMYSRFQHQFGSGGSSIDNNASILVSCRDERIYKIEKDSTIRELLILKCQVVEMIWLDGELEIIAGIGSYPNFVIATVNRQLAAYGSESGSCKWLIQLEAQITSLISLPPTSIGPHEMNLIGVGSKANRIDFYTSESGLIVDSIYMSLNDYPEALVFGRFGREDNCLITTTHLGHLMIFILKRTAKFAHGHCLSSASAYATNAITRLENEINFVNSRTNPSSNFMQKFAIQERLAATSGSDKRKNLNDPTSVPSGFKLSDGATLISSQLINSRLNQNSNSNEDKLDEHNCDQLNESTAKLLNPKLASITNLIEPKLRLPVKSKNFVEQIVDQSNQSKGYHSSRSSFIHPQ